LHKKFCGRSNKLILENLEKLSGKSRLDGPLILPRIPLVPGITATKENLIPIAGYLKKLGLMKVGLLQYNPLWASKISALRKKDDLPIDASLLEWMPSSLYDECKEYFSEFSIS
jgi:pyruvate formate lyase activating enzyme